MAQKPRIARTEKELKDTAKEHLLYEVDMLRGAAQHLAMARPDRFIVNVCLEAFTAHARALVHFLHPEGSISDDDVLAEDYFDSRAAWENVRGSQLPGALEKVRTRVGKEIVHLTYSRLSVTPEAKEWNVSAISGSLNELLKKFADASPKLDHAVRERLARSSSLSFQNP